MPRTYEPIASVTLGSAGTITFSDIPQSFTDVRVIVHGRSSWTTDGYENVNIRFNNDSGSNYSQTALCYGPTSFRTSSQTAMQMPRLNPSDGGSTAFSISIIDVMSYANTNVHKTALAVGAGQREALIPSRHVGLWRSTSAITSIFLGASQGSTFVSGTVASLYGIKAA